jgi:4-amino-4-deoxy-L-arabinose transferase-like glycosyltransferase
MQVKKLFEEDYPIIDFVDHKPLVSYFFAAILIYIFGDSIFILRIFVLVTVILSALLVYKISKHLTNSNIIGIYSGLIYSLFISMPYSWSFDFMTTNIMELFGLFSIFIAVAYKSNKGLFISGVLIGISALSKQPGILYFFIVRFYRLNPEFTLV